MPPTIGCIDGKHIRMECPEFSGTLYHNYKEIFSMVLLAICDANYCFTLFDLDRYGSSNDSGVLANSQMGQMLKMTCCMYHLTPNYRKMICMTVLTFY